MFKCISKMIGIAGYIIQYGCITHCTFEYIGDFVVCSGPSMEPTLYSNNILVTERITPRLHRVQRGDIIIAKCPTNPTQHICKRIVGLPGDKITSTEPVINNNLLIIGKKSTDLEEAEIDDKTDQLVRLSSKSENNSSSKNEKSILVPIEALKKLRSRTIEIIVPRGHVWIEGDNSENSSDSRFYGPIPQGLIKSRAVCRLWPLSDIKLLI